MISPIEIYRQYKRVILAKDPIDKWLFTRDYVTVCFRLALCPITDPNFRMRWYTWIAGLFYLDDFVFLIYTLVLFRNDLIRCVETLYTFGVVVSTPIFYYRIVTPIRAEYQNIVFFGGKYIYGNSQNRRFQLMMNRRASQLIRIVLIISGFLIGGYVLFETMPLATFLLTGQRTMVTLVQLPYFDPTSNVGYILNVINQTVLSHFVVFVNVGVECTFAMIINSMWIGVDIIRYSVDEMQDQLQSNGDWLQHRKRFRNILIQIQDLDRLILTWKQVFDDAFLFQPISLAISIALATFCIVITQSPPAFGYVIFSYFQLMFLCYLGNQVKLINEAIWTALYGLPWYTFPKDQKKDISHMLNRIQNGCTLTIGPFSELNFETSTIITKTIYTYLMMLIRTVKKH